MSLLRLNNNLLPGRKRHLDIVHLLINFRLHPVALVGDTSRMFYCVNLNEEFRDYYRLLWNNNKNEMPTIYRFKILTMGTVDSPFLSISTIHYHLDKTAKEEPELKEACELIKKHLYVDDLMAAVDSTSEAIKLRKIISAIFIKMKMKIQKGTSNSSDLLKTIPRDECSPVEEITETKKAPIYSENDITFNDPEVVSQTTKCLGMTWTPKEDVFHYKTYENLEEERSKRFTKRGISSLIPSIYDPTGLLQPFIIQGKLILQSAWTHKDKNGKSLNWDDALPEEIKEPWIKWIKDIKEISKFTTNRYLFKNMEEIPTRDKLYLHCFADAGQNAWGISIYIRFYNSLITKYESHLIYATSRVAPTKTTLSTPKKELNSILLACQKISYIAEALAIQKTNMYIHTDSLVALHWINQDKNSLKTYVSNRVNKIQQAEITILHVPGKENPADLCSKPKPTKTYVNNQFWLHGPQLLEESNETLEEKYKLSNVMQRILSVQEDESLRKEMKKEITIARSNKIQIETENCD